MISKIDHHTRDIAQQMYPVFQASYAVEAALLKATDFPPLKRTIPDFLESATDFYAFWNANQMVAIIELREAIDRNSLHICSLVVHPSHFRQGIGAQLLKFALDSTSAHTITVETGLDNLPAITLYKKLGFKDVGTYLTDIGITKIKLQKDAHHQT